MAKEMRYIFMVVGAALLFFLSKELLLDKWGTAKWYIFWDKLFESEKMGFYGRFIQDSDFWIPVVAAGVGAVGGHFIFKKIKPEQEANSHNTEGS
jgi:hypothetical protein